jgi:alpha-galactosidase
VSRRPRPSSLTRRDVVRLALLAPLAGVGGQQAASGEGRLPRGLDLEVLKRSPGRAVPEGDPSHALDVELHREWNGPTCRPRLVNTGRHPLALREVVLFDVSHDLPPETSLYGEGFQMLSQTGGTLGQPLDLGGYTDAKHYRLPQPDGSRVLYSLLTLTAPAGAHAVLAFTSCHRFSGRFLLQDGVIQVVVDTEGLELAPGAAWELEELTFLAGPDRDALLDDVARRLNQNHPPLRFPSPPAGWCSWYCFGPRVTAQQVLANLDTIAARIPGLRYVQVDDGYQPAMGDWLDTGPAFGGDVRGVLKAIRERGFEPAIWVAPFIAEAASNLFRQRPEWFVRDGDGQPLRSDRVTFSGWRRAPWYALDGTHPEAQRHLENIFRTMREEWGCSYFKLDATFWGAIHGGRFHDPQATRVEAYRRGMEALRRGAGDAFILGCNHPIWASLGLIHGSRSSNDIKRTWSRVKSTARENLMRNWQNGRLWWNDPDAVVLMGELSEEEFRFHATALFASGGMMLSGDDLTGISHERMEMLRMLQPPTASAARFTDGSLSVGTVELSGRRAVCFLNWDDTPRTLSHRLPGLHHTVELWSGEVRDHAREVEITLPPRSGRVVLCTPAATATVRIDMAAFERARVLAAADLYLREPPITITASTSPRSAGGRQDFFSEADYWWPDPQDPGGPYIQRDGMTNPDNFVDHRRYLMRLSVQVPALAAAFRLTRNDRYAAHAAAHLRAWFVEDKTRMNPHLRYAQAIQGRVTGRGIGIIDTLHLVEVARAVEALSGSGAFSAADRDGIRNWFADYLRWMTTHPYGIEEREARNNHGTCWALQVASFARLVGDDELTSCCRHRFKAVLLPGQMGPDGSFPREMRRTKPYGYALFNLEAMAGLCQVLSIPADDLWSFELADGRGMRKALDFMVPYVREKKAWPHPPDVMYDAEWPMRQNSLLFGGLALGRPEYLDLWKTLRADSDVDEVVRNFFIRQPLLWV